MEQIGLVTKEIGKKVEIEIKRISGCGGGCKTCSGCDTPGHSVIVDNNLNAQLGDLVKVKGEPKNFLKYTFIVYLIPLLMLILGIYLSNKILVFLQITNVEEFSFMIGLLFLGMGYFIVKNIDKSIEKKGENIISIIEIL